MVAAASGSGGGKRITQNEFTDKAWQAIIAAPETAKQVQMLSSLATMSRRHRHQTVPLRRAAWLFGALWKLHAIV